MLITIAFVILKTYIYEHQFIPNWKQTKYSEYLSVWKQNESNFAWVENTILKRKDYTLAPFKNWNLAINDLMWCFLQIIQNAKFAYLINISAPRDKRCIVGNGRLICIIWSALSEFAWYRGHVNHYTRLCLWIMVQTPYVSFSYSGKYILVIIINN